MAIASINDIVGCYDCKHADQYGRDCKYGLMFPVMLAMAGSSKCPNFKRKTTEQIEEQIKHESEVKNEICIKKKG